MLSTLSTSPAFELSGVMTILYVAGSVVPNIYHMAVGPHIGRKVYRAEGIPGLWAGVTSAMARVAVGSSLQLSSYDTIKVMVAPSEQWFSLSVCLGCLTFSHCSQATVEFERLNLAHFQFVLPLLFRPKW